MSKEIKIEEPTDDEIFEYLNQFWKSCEDGLCYIFTTKHIEPAQILGIETTTNKDGKESYSFKIKYLGKPAGNKSDYTKEQITLPYDLCGTYWDFYKAEKEF